MARSRAATSTILNDRAHVGCANRSNRVGLSRHDWNRVPQPHLIGRGFRRMRKERLLAHGGSRASHAAFLSQNHSCRTIWISPQPIASSQRRFRHLLRKRDAPSWPGSRSFFWSGWFLGCMRSRLREARLLPGRALMCASCKCMHAIWWVPRTFLACPVRTSMSRPRP